jgi:hypothetical protein
VSEQTEEQAVEDALIAAIRVHEPTAVVTGWVIAAQLVVPDNTDRTWYTHTVADGQGLAHMLVDLTAGGADVDE